MKFLIFSFVFYLVFTTFRQVSMLDIIKVHPHTTECNGTVVLESNEGSVNEAYEYSVEAQSLRISKDGKRRKRFIRRLTNLKHPETQKKLRFSIARMTGNCCWRIFDRHPRQGIPLNMVRSQEYEPGWTIRYIELMKNCHF